MNPTLKENGNEIETEKPKSNFWDYRSYRLYLTIIMGLCIFANTLARATLSIGMVCLVNTTASIMNSSHTSDQNHTPSQCEGSMVQDKDYGGHETWNSAEQSFLFSAIYWGGVFSSIPAGLFADRYSPKKLVLVCFAIQSIGCMLVPVSIIYGGLIPLFVVRFIMGIGGQAVFNPAITVIMVRWIPPGERSTVIALYTGGFQIALMIAMPLNAWLCRQKEVIGGWPLIFYVTGAIMILTVLPWCLFVTDKPEDCKWISEKEFKYIKMSLSNQKLGNKKGFLKRVPWLAMLKSHALWSCIIGNLAACIMMATLESYIPTYFKEALHLDLESNGALSALPYFAQWTSKLGFAIIADALKRKTSFSHTWICRIFNCLNTFVAGAFLVACGYVHCGQTALAVFFLTVSIFSASGQITGYFTSLVCIAPAYTGLINAFGRAAGQMGSVIAPYIVGAITVEGTSSEWLTVYYITAAGLFVTGIHFLIFGSAKVQPWGMVNDDVTITTGENNNQEKIIEIEAAKLNGDLVKKWVVVPTDTQSRKIKSFGDK